MNFNIANLLPDDVSVYSGFGFVRIVVAIFLALVVVRSCIHLFAQDGGAQRIAGVDTSVAGGNNIIAMFHQWGAVQLTLVGLLIVVYVRYPGLTPLVILTLALDPVTRAMASRVKKLTSTKTPPGARLNWPAFFVLFALLVLSLFE
ncbi:MAG: hypothetical protein EBY96_00210 [Actinobacteria bacterium]|nr:hypothetical protein [Actinomycetota bacterium]